MNTSVTEAIGVGGGSVVVLVVVGDVVVVVVEVVVVVDISAAGIGRPAASTGITASNAAFIITGGSARACITGIGIGRMKGPSGGGGCRSPEGFLSYNSTVTVTGEVGMTSREPWIVRSYPGRTTLGATNR